MGLGTALASLVDLSAPVGATATTFVLSPAKQEAPWLPERPAVERRCDSNASDC